MAIEHRMDGALGRDGNSGESAQEALANLAGTPGRVLALHVQDEVFHLEGKLMRIAVGPSAAVRQPFDPTLLVATEDFVAWGPPRTHGLQKEPAAWITISYK